MNISKPKPPKPATPARVGGAKEGAAPKADAIGIPISEAALDGGGDDGVAPGLINEGGDDPELRAVVYDLLSRTKDVIEGRSTHPMFYYGDKDLGRCKAILISKHRESDALDRSNFEVVLDDLKTRFPNDVDTFRASSDLVGWIDHVTVRMYDQEGNLTPAGMAAAEWVLNMRDYPVANGDAFSAEELVDGMAHTRSAIPSLVWGRTGELALAYVKGHRLTLFEDGSVELHELNGYDLKVFASCDAALDFVKSEEAATASMWDPSAYDDTFRPAFVKALESFRAETVAEHAANGAYFLHDPDGRLDKSIALGERAVNGAYFLLPPFHVSETLDFEPFRSDETTEELMIDKIHILTTGRVVVEGAFGSVHGGSVDELGNWLKNWRPDYRHKELINALWEASAHAVNSSVDARPAFIGSEPVEPGRAVRISEVFASAAGLEEGQRECVFLGVVREAPSAWAMVGSGGSGLGDEKVFVPLEHLSVQ